tara:strand:+ start:1166 stop:1294 length:129 start_codon:yes stop_codon:yes gene_type:complete
MEIKRAHIQKNRDELQYPEIPDQEIGREKDGMTTILIRNKRN